MRQFVILFTGISGSGKSTLANAVAKELELLGVQVSVIDGDDSRELVGNIFGHSREERMKMGRVNRMAGHYLVNSGINVIYALVCPYEEIRKLFREFFGELYIEVYVKADRELCAKRDVKGLYKLCEQGKLKHINGTNDVFETPEHSNLVLDTGRMSVGEAKEEIIGYLWRNGFIE